MEEAESDEDPSIGVYHSQSSSPVHVTDAVSEGNTQSDQIQNLYEQNITSTAVRTVSQPSAQMGSPPGSPIHRAFSDGLNPTTGPDNDQRAQRLVSKFARWWKTMSDNSKKLKHEQSEEYKMRHKLKYHFMSPMQKYKHGRKPWKLFIQVVKIIIVTAQVALFGAERFASVLFINHTHQSLRYLFVQGYTEPQPFNYYSRQQLANAVIFAKDAYSGLVNKSIGIFWHGPFDREISLCEERYNNTAHDSGLGHSGPTVAKCVLGVPYTLDGLLELFHKKRYFDNLKAIYLKFNLTTMFINGLRMLHRPECYHLDNQVYVDNSNHDGKLQVTFKMANTLMTKCPKEFKVTKDASVLRRFYIAFDVLVVGLCAISLVLCVRSMWRSTKLASVAREYFHEYKGEELTKSDLFGLINKWFIVIVLSDLLSIIGSIYKIMVDFRDIHYYNICSLFLGIGVLLVWVGILRFFTYLPNYNILLIALRVAAPNLMRFMFCALFIFFGFSFCGWIVLGPYHEKFDSFSKTVDCLYSLLNGDDMYVTFNIMSQASTAVWIFSKIYLYVFISLFIYVVLSTFISIVSDSYERIKFDGKMPPTRIESFMAGPGGGATYCEVCSRDEELSESSITALYNSVQNNHDQLSPTASIASIN